MALINTVLTLKDLPTAPEHKIGWPWTEQTEPLPETMPDGSNWPRISIVTPSYNQGQYIEETIRSILLQGYPNLEYIIIDAGSTDQTVEIIKKYEMFLSYWVSESDNGQAHAINKGLSLCTGEIFNWINSDDFLNNNALSTIALSFTKEYDLLAGACRNFYDETEDSHVVQNANLGLPKTIWQNLKSTYHQPGVWLRTNLIIQCGGIDENLHYCFDGDMMMQYLYLYKKIIYISDTIVNFRLHKDSKTIICRNGENKFLQDYIYSLNKFSNDKNFLKIHSYCKLRIRQLNWIKIIQDINNQTHLANWQKIVRILFLVWKDPIVRISRLSMGAIKKLIKSNL
jgi:glycosyltransferase involved in cell wall biosynthesis